MSSLRHHYWFFFFDFSKLFCTDWWWSLKGTINTYIHSYFIFNLTKGITGPRIDDITIFSWEGKVCSFQVFSKIRDKNLKGAKNLFTNSMGPISCSTHKELGNIIYLLHERGLNVWIWGVFLPFFDHILIKFFYVMIYLKR